MSMRTKWSEDNESRIFISALTALLSTRGI